MHFVHVWLNMATACWNTFTLNNFLEHAILLPNIRNCRRPSGPREVSVSHMLWIHRPNLIRRQLATHEPRPLAVTVLRLNQEAIVLF